MIAQVSICEWSSYPEGRVMGLLRNIAMEGDGRTKGTCRSSAPRDHYELKPELVECPKIPRTYFPQSRQLTDQSH
ncbi:hypothetical protein TNCV_4438501 [Trichonephila clavipes]|nr:hypothetical protein TNCV_4438501 [Trichonephila clavipes]